MQRKLISWVALFLVIILTAFPSAPAAHAQESGPQSTDNSSSEGSIQLSAPFDFGYTVTYPDWYDWVDAKTNGQPLNIEGVSGQKTVTLPFDFPYYGLLYNQLTVDLNGMVAFSTPYPKDKYGLSVYEAPNNYIFACDNFLAVGSTYTDGDIYMVQGGTAPDRYIAIEWYHAAPQHNLSKLMTFEIILYENGNFRIQYQSLPEWWQMRLGFENLIGSEHWYYEGISNSIAGIAFLVEYPVSQDTARILVVPWQSNMFMYAGIQQTYFIDIYNNGSLPAGKDTYELDIQNANGIPVSFDLLVGGIPTPLIDTNGNGTVDTGAILEGEMVRLRAHLEAPVTVIPGDYGVLHFSMVSAADSSVYAGSSLYLSIPGSFVEAYHNRDDSRIHVNSYSPVGVIESSFPVGMISGEYPGPSVVQSPNGDILVVWTEARCLGENCIQIQELYYAVLSSDGTIKHAPTRLTDWSGATIYSMDELPAVAAAADGTFGISWLRFQINETESTRLNNIFFTVIGSDGIPVGSPMNVTGETTWIPMYGIFDEGVEIYRPQIAVLENRYALTWEAYRHQTDNMVLSNAYYAIFDTQNQVIKTATNGTQHPLVSYHDPSINTPAITTIQRADQGYFLITYGMSDPKIMGFTVDATGNSSSPQLLDGTPLNYDYRYYKPVHLPNQNLMLIGQRGAILLDSANQKICQVAYYAHEDRFVSAAVHEDSSVTILFTDYLMTTRISGTDCSTLTSEFWIHDYESPTQSYPVYTNTGYAFTHALDASVPTGIDLRVSTGARKESERNLVIRLENAGLAVSPSTTLSITLDPHLTLVDSSAAPDVVAGQTYTWNLGSLGFQGTSQIFVTLGYGSGTEKGVKYPVQISAATGGAETNPEDNIQTVYLAAPYLTNIPLIYR